MKTFRTLSAAVALSSVLTAPAFAGIITTMKDGMPPPTTSSATTAGIIPTDAPSQDDTASDVTTTSSSVTQTALQLPRSVLSLA